MNDYIRERFPDLQPISGPPSLVSFNGIGTQLYGRRDYDHETNTYVTTLTFCLIFVPIVAIKAYRVADARDGGWHILGQVPLSRFARRWNVGLLLALIALAGTLAWRSHTQSENYLASVKLEAAERAAAEGQYGKAAEGYRDVMFGKSTLGSDAKLKFANLLETADGDGVELAQAYKIAVNLNRTSNSVIADLYTVGVGQAQKRITTDPKGALAIFEVVAPLSPNVAASLELRKTLLEKLSASQPNDLDIASKLAVIYEASGDLAKCEKLLMPHAAKLGTREGAAVLGRIYSAKGKHDEALKLLEPYVNEKIPLLRSAEFQYKSAVDAAEKRIVAGLQSGKMAGFDYTAYDRAGKAAQQQMVEDFIITQLKNDTSLQVAQQSITETSGVVQAALDLGLIHLMRGQATTDPEQRKSELTAAEATFLSVRTFAGESENYRLSLGQVYHWLGKSTEAKKEFEEVLAKKNRATATLLAVAHILREIGDITQARKLSEEAYQKETNLEQKQSVAVFRALIFVDIDDRIDWLSKADSNKPEVRASLAASRGHKFMQDGNEQEAARHFQQSISIYATQPENAATLNNSALMHIDLARINHDAKEFAKGVEKLDRAIALQPTDSILLSNSSGTVLTAALGDIVAAKIDLKLLKQDADFDHLSFLYADVAGKQVVADKLKSHPGIVKARTYCEKLVLLSPKQAHVYSTLSSLYAHLLDTPALKSVADRMAKVELDLTQMKEQYRDLVDGKTLEKSRPDMLKALARYREVFAAVKDRKDATFAVAVSNLVKGQIGSEVFGEPANSEEMVTLAESAYKVAPSMGSLRTLEMALHFRAHRKLMDQSPEYKKLAGATQRSLSDEVLRYVLFSGGPLAETASKLDDVKRWRALLKTELESGARMNSHDWAVLVGGDSKSAETVAKQVVADELSQHARRIYRELNQFKAAGILSEYYSQRLHGEANAEKTLEGLKTFGITLPEPRK